MATSETIQAYGGGRVMTAHVIRYGVTIPAERGTHDGKTELVAQIVAYFNDADRRPSTTAIYEVVRPIISTDKAVLIALREEIESEGKRTLAAMFNYCHSAYAPRDPYWTFDFVQFVRDGGVEKFADKNTMPSLPSQATLGGIIN